MVAVVVMNAEEMEIIRSGSIPEPRFRPFPGSRKAREREEAFEREWLLEGYGVESTEGSPVATSGELGIGVDQSFPRTVAAQQWRRSARDLALLASRLDGGLTIFAVGMVQGGPRTRAPGVRRIEVRARYVLAKPLDLAVVRSRLDAQNQRRLDERLNGHLRPLSPKLGELVIDAVEASAPGITPVLRESLREALAEQAASRQAKVPRPAVPVQEAMSSALHIFAPAWHRLEPEPEPAPAPSAWAMNFEVMVGRGSESDIITDDASVFPGWGRETHSFLGWWEFRSKGRRLLVKNINVSTAETATGADLVYVRRDPDTFVLVQYKLLVRVKDGRLIFKPDGRLDSQVSRMGSLERLHSTTGPDDRLTTYRIGDGFTFVKFIEPNAARPERPGELAPGFYFPSEYVRRWLLKPSAGPRGGIVYPIDEDRHIAADTFARLVRDSWVGSTGDATLRLRQVFSMRDSENDLVLAVDEPVSNELPTSTG